jgi:hypothetical protein
MKNKLKISSFEVLLDSNNQILENKIKYIEDDIEIQIQSRIDELLDLLKTFKNDLNDLREEIKKF